MKCSVCQHLEHHHINQAILAGAHLRQLAKTYGLSKSALHRHKQHLLAKMHTVTHFLEQRAQQDQLAVLAGLFHHLHRLAERAAEAGQEKPLCLASREAARLQRQMQRLSCRPDFLTAYQTVLSPRWAFQPTVIPVDLDTLASTRRSLTLFLEDVCTSDPHAPFLALPSTPDKPESTTSINNDLHSLAPHATTRKKARTNISPVQEACDLLTHAATSGSPLLKDIITPLLDTAHHSRQPKDPHLPSSTPEPETDDPLPSPQQDPDELSTLTPPTTHTQDEPPYLLPPDDDHPPFTPLPTPADPQPEAPPSLLTPEASSPPSCPWPQTTTPSPLTSPGTEPGQKRDQDPSLPPASPVTDNLTTYIDSSFSTASTNFTPSCPTSLDHQSPPPVPKPRPPWPPHPKADRSPLHGQHFLGEDDEEYRPRKRRDKWYYW